MKSKKLLLSTCIALLSISAYIVFSSHSNASSGVMGAANSTQSCAGGGCHGSVADTATTIVFSGVPAIGYVPGTVYPVSVTITNSSKTKAGFDLAFSGGSITGNPTNTMIMSGKELHHTAPFTAVSGVTTINFNWTAPASGVVVLNILGNAVNGTGTAAGDGWAFKVYDIVAAPNAISSQNIGTLLNVYPNPTINNVTIDSKENIISAEAIGMMGNRIAVNITKNGNNTYSANTSALASGNYLLLLKGEKENFHALISKQ
jgi:Secretion system C-terminal sorting domain